MKKVIISICTLTFLLQEMPIMAAPLQPAKTKTFAQWCQQRNSVPVATKLTIDLLLKQAETKNCKLADARLINLKELSLPYDADEISDLQPLSSLTNLTALVLGNFVNSTKISDLQHLSGLNKLTFLILTGDRIKDLKPLSRLNELTDLTISGNGIKDLKPLSNLTNLTSLYLDSDAITDIQSLAGLRNLTNLAVSGQPLIRKVQRQGISDLNPLAGLKRLEQLNLQNNKITNKVCPFNDICEF